MTNEVFLEDIEALNAAHDLIQNLKGIEEDTPLMSGRFNCHSFRDGLSVHITNAIEKQDSSNSLELPEGLSFNFIFAGWIDFTFDSQEYRVGADKPEEVYCTSIINNAKEMMTRHMCKGMHIKKVNIFVERQWLELRSQNAADKQFIQSLFRQKCVYCWKPSQKILKTVRSLLDKSEVSSFSERLGIEQTVINILSGCIDGLFTQVQKTQASDTGGVVENTSLKTKVDLAIKQHQTLPEIASLLGMSVRTLQRKFKARYQLNVADYIKIYRMNLAKKALVIEQLSIGEAAYIAGYNHSSNFISAFKKKFGLTPSVFIEKHQNKI